MKCPNCGAEMKYTGEVIDPRVVLYECPKCGKKVAK